MKVFQKLKRGEKRKEPLPKYGDKREDFYTFRGYDKDGYEMWYSPVTWSKMTLDRRFWNHQHVENRRKASRKHHGIPEPLTPRPEKCECCGQPPNDKYKRGLHVDHDHVTGKFRGWLCQKCNNAIGLLDDTVEGVERALLYVKKTCYNICNSETP